ncbi:MAG: 50S ribosomal protein L4 [Dehalococcoidia bacterium]
MKVKLIDHKGSVIGDHNINKEIVNHPINEQLVHQSIVTFQANQRQGTHKTKSRSEVRGGGRKPFSQKGTGRARAGTTRSPIWRGGGIVFGPQPRSYRKNLNKKMKTGALLSTLAFKLSEKKLIVLQDFNDTNKFSKTKDAKNLLDSLNVAKHSLLVLDGADNQSIRSTNNIDNITTLSSDLINASAVARSEYMIITKKGITNLIQNRLKLETKKEVKSKPEKTTKNKEETK